MANHSPATWCTVYDELRSKIKSGLLRAESTIVRAQVAPHVSDFDFERAVDRLKDEGLLRMSGEDEILIATTRARSRRTTSFIADYAQQGRVPSISTIHCEIISIDDAPKFVVDSFRDTSTNMLVQHLHVQSVDGEPHAIANSFVPYDIIGSKYKKIINGDMDLHSIFCDLGYNVTEKEETLYVDSPTMEERDFLSIMDKPMLQVVRLDCAVWSNEKLLEVCLLCDRSDLYEFYYKVGVK